MFQKIFFEFPEFIEQRENDILPKKPDVKYYSIENINKINQTLAYFRNEIETINAGDIDCNYSNSNTYQFLMSLFKITTNYVKTYNYLLYHTEELTKELITIATETEYQFSSQELREGASQQERQKIFNELHGGNNGIFQPLIDEGKHAEFVIAKMLYNKKELFSKHLPLEDYIASVDNYDAKFLIDYTPSREELH